MIIKFDKKKIPQISKKLLDKILKMDNKKARVVALFGNLGAGKTTLTQEFGRQLGIKENIISPTFVIMKIYKINKDSKYYPHFKKLVHIDAYRLESSTELLKIGWKEIEGNKENLIVIEWPERVSKCISPLALPIFLSHIEENIREINF